MCIKICLIWEEVFWVEWFLNLIKIVVFLYVSLEDWKSGLVEVMNCVKLVFVVVLNYLCNEIKFYIFLIRIFWVVYRIFFDFLIILFCLFLVDIYRYLFLSFSELKIYV